MYLNNEQIDELCNLLNKAYFALDMDDYGGDRHELAGEIGVMRYNILKQSGKA